MSRVGRVVVDVPTLIRITVKGTCWEDSSIGVCFLYK